MHEHITRSVFTEFTAQLYNFTRRSNDFNPHNLITRYTVLNGTVTACIGCYVTADEARVPATRIACIEEAFFIDSFLKCRRCNTRFGNNNHIFFINFDDLVHAFNGDDNAAVNSYGTGSQTGPCCTGNHDNIVVITQFYNLCHFFRCGR